MKLKKQYIVILLLIILIVGIGLILKSKNVKISSIFNKNNKLASYTFKKTGTCNNWIDTSLIAPEDIIFRGSNYIVIEGKNTNIDGGYEGYTFINNIGCAVELSDVTTTTPDVNDALCTAIRENINNRPKGNIDNWNYWARIYNEEFVEKGFCSGHIEYGETTPKSSCSIEWDQNDEDGFVGAYFKVDGTSVEIDYYISKCGCSTKLKNFISEGQKDIYESQCGEKLVNDNKCNYISVTDDTGFTRNTYYFDGVVQGENCSSWVKDETIQDGTDSVLGGYYHYKGNPDNTRCYYNYTKDNTGKVCNYEYSNDSNQNLFLINSCSWSMDEYLEECKKVSEDKCGDPNFKNFLIEGMKKNNSLSKRIDTYNSKCDDDIDYGTVIVYQNDDANGLSCNKNGWEFNEIGSCKRSATSGTIEGPNVDNLTKYGTHKFIGWSENSSCSAGTITSSNTFTINFTGEKKYYACYEQESTTTGLFESNTKKTIDTKYVNETNTCDENKIKITNTYYRKTTKIEPYKTTLSENTYCNVVCEDVVNVSYPSIFETVPAGQYFELIYEPEITTTRTCTSEFNYNKWLDDYKNAIDAELQKMDALNKAQAYYDAAYALENNSHCCGCCSPGPESTCTPSFGNYDSQEKNYYISSTSTVQKATVSYDECDGSDKNQVQTSAQTALSTAKSEYKTAVENRVKLEQNSLQCYTILDQDSNDEKTYETVFKENYNQVIDVNESKYSIKTPKVTVSSKNNSTQSTYATYIKGKTGITDDFLTKTTIAPINNTVQFYDVYPKLSFKYDDGSKGEPRSNTNIEQELASEAHVKSDTGTFTSRTSDTYIKDSSTNDSVSKNFYLNGTNGTYINFHPYKATSITRQVQYYFTYHESEEYFSKKHSGETALNKQSDSNYASLSRLETFTTKESAKKAIKNHVYPVSLKAVTGNYKVGLLLENKQDQTECSGSSCNANNYLSTTTFGTEFDGTYTCDYKITNDILTLSGDKSGYKDLKSNTIFRSVATSDIDPNNRVSTGNLGDNWSNAKGLAVKELIKLKENNATTTNDTYNPKNLEYSFTLTPGLIHEIEENYNDATDYDDFNLKCATDDGRECISKFLTYLADGKICSYNTNFTTCNAIYTQNNYSAINSFDSYELEKIRNKWKYYIESPDIVGLSIASAGDCVSIGDNLYSCKRGKMTLDKYLSLYEKWGVLP